jgi:hypothetical protein
MPAPKDNAPEWSGTPYSCVQNPKINAIEILPLANSPLLTLKFSYPDGTPVNGTLNYAMSTSRFPSAASFRSSMARPPV